jgi:tetratricopeptide (TPR) repeat protein
MFRRIAQSTIVRRLRAGQVEVAQTASPRPPKPRSILEDPSLPLHRLASHAIFSFALGGVALLAVLPPAAAKTQENLVVATPFEVGESPAGNYLAALVAGAERDTVAAATFFREVLRADPHNKDLIERAFVATISNGNMDQAFALAERLIAHDPDNGLAHLALGVRALKLHEYVAARANFARGSGQEPDLTATLLTAWSYEGSGEPKRAIVTVDKLQDENFAVFRNYHKALIAEMAGDARDAKTWFEAAYDTDKNTLRLVDAYARFMSRQGDRDDAINTYEAFDQVLPDHPIVRAALDDLKAGKTLAPVIKTVDQGAGEVLYGLGAAGGRQGDDLAGMIYLRLSLYLDPQNSLAALTLGDIYERIKQYEQAIDVYQTVEENDPLRLTADIEIGQVLEDLGRTADATKYLQNLVDEHPKDEETLSALGNLQRAHEHYAEAAATYTRAIEDSTKPEKANWPLYYFRGISYERQNDWPPAEADFKHALELFPDQPLVLNYLGYSWVDKGLNLDEAFPMLRRAVELRPTDGYIVDSLGWADYKLGHYDEAVKELERAIDLKPSDPVINDHLGDAYWRVGRKLEAHFQWNHARDLGPEPEDMPKILAKIAHGLSDDTKPAAVTDVKPTSDDKPAAADADRKQQNGG